MMLTSQTYIQGDHLLGFVHLRDDLRRQRNKYNT